MNASIRDTSFFLSQRASVLGAIVALHLLVGYALTSGLAGNMMQLIVPPIQTDILQDIRKIEEPPPPAEPQVANPDIEIPPPLITIRIPVERPTALTSVTTVATPSPPIAAPAPAPVRAPTPVRRVVLHANIGKNFPNPDDYYPPSSLRLEEQGAVKVKVCVAANGRLAGPPQVLKTSGSARLDEAAIRLARAGNYLAASIDGVPTTECLELPIRFHMRS